MERGRGAQAAARQTPTTARRRWHGPGTPALLPGKGLGWMGTYTGSCHPTHESQNNLPCPQRPQPRGWPCTTRKLHLLTAHGVQRDCEAIKSHLTLSKSCFSPVAGRDAYTASGKRGSRAGWLDCLPLTTPKIAGTEELSDQHGLRGCTPIHKTDTNSEATTRIVLQARINPVHCFHERQDREKQLLCCQEKIATSISVIPVQDSPQPRRDGALHPCSAAAFSVQNHH